MLLRSEAALMGQFLPSSTDGTPGGWLLRNCLGSHLRAATRVPSLVWA